MKNNFQVEKLKLTKWICDQHNFDTIITKNITVSRFCHKYHLLNHKSETTALLPHALLTALDLNQSEVSLCAPK